MSGTPFFNRCEFEQPTVCRIRVMGHMDDSLSARLGGMVITRAFTAEKQQMTILIGQMRDQAALSNVLNKIYEMHLPVLTVESLSL